MARTTPTNAAATPTEAEPVLHMPSAASTSAFSCPWRAQAQPLPPP
eukprot:CAMPEP_0177542776 /NCGR_PEP_ID=MMETSP0369-20130122/61005_1 /TAXON_ID=447022 ORGANISM="Scrippsiella hangoei-like, Strain SHHI-4" /NCGR_SAMPLE_ID=MMETSP0369 /ASSEMBLY_ACC=CAM_ASM_000364 /LENGTH=45 /DNA_ID= /DNA_START= /DNA_END= /DNA_ORIENTATION=